MTRALQTQTFGRTLQHAIAATLAGLTLFTANTAHAQRALGYPFVGRNQFSVSVTERSRRRALFGVDDPEITKRAPRGIGYVGDLTTVRRKRGRPDPIDLGARRPRRR